MLKKYYPGKYVDSVFSIDFQKLYDKGYRAILFDVDNTLVHHGDDSTKEVDELFRQIQEIGFRTILVSDNSEERLQRFLKNINSPYIAEAGKPGTAGYHKALQMLGVSADKAVCIGDQIFTDILGANKSGIESILVHFIQVREDEKIGKRRYVEKLILKLYKHSKDYNRLGDITKSDHKITQKKRRQFGDLHPVFYKIAVKKEIFRRHIKNLLSKEKLAQEKSDEKLPVVVYEFRSNMIKRAPGVDITTQLNKAENIRIAAACIDGIIIHPGEVFSFWKLVGKVTKRKGYLEGRVIVRKKLTVGLGGGLCNLSNSLNRMVLHSPLTLAEFHTHSDALAPDEGKRIPLGAGTSVSYNYVDYRFKNNTDQDFQVCIWCDGEDLCGELRAVYEPENIYELVEEDRHFRKEGNKYYNVSKIYRVAKDRQTNQQTDKELIWDNHSEVMFDYSLIPDELVRT